MSQKKQCEQSEHARATVEKAVADTMKEFEPSPMDDSVLLYYPLEAGERTIEDIKNNH